MEIIRDDHLGIAIQALHEASHGGWAEPPSGLTLRRLVRALQQGCHAIGYAHARGVIHRDIKPGNVLLRKATGGVVLVDFGLARAGDMDGGAVLNAGTPTYMAPEQIQQMAHDIGPWTDMYALGCLAWSLVCGRPPFTGDLEQVLDAHLNEPLPKMITVKDVPPGFEAWVAQLLRKSPHQRFVRAADASHALAAFAPLSEQDSLLVEPVFTSEASSEDSPRTESTVGRNSTDSISHCDDTQVMVPRKVKKKRASAGLPGPLPQVGRSLLWAERGELPPIPEDWREEHPPRPFGHLLGTGLGMFGLRSFPLVGRSEEQTHLWDELKRCREFQHARAVVIEGSDGTGKTYQAEWPAELTKSVQRFHFAPSLGDPTRAILWSL
jgi:serine/threonine-protein kinase